MALLTIQIGTTRSVHWANKLFLSQRVDGHHDFQIQFMVSNEYLSRLDALDDYIHQPIRISLEDEEDSHAAKLSFSGIIKKAEAARWADGAMLTLEGKSPTILLAEGGSERTFVNLPFSDIAREVLEPYQKAFPEIWISGQLSRNISFTSQRENDFSFLNHFRHPCYYTGDCLCIGWKKPAAATPLIFDLKDGNLRDFHFSVSAASPKIELGGYDYSQHQYWPRQTYNPVRLFSNGLWERLLNRSRTNRPSVPSKWIEARVSKKDDLAGMANSWLSLQLGQLAVLSGKSTAIGLHPGAVIYIEYETEGLPAGNYLVLSVNHTYELGGEYENHFQAIPQELVSNWVPWPVYAPPVDLEEAEVVRREKTPEFGAVTVRFDFDKNKNESPLLRVLTLTTDGGGCYMLPAPGEKVLVYFQGPDNPVCVLGSLYNGKTNAKKWKGNGFGFRTVDGCLVEFRDGAVCIDGKRIEIG